MRARIAVFLFTCLALAMGLPTASAKPRPAVRAKPKPRRVVRKTKPPRRKARISVERPRLPQLDLARGPVQNVAKRGRTSAERALQDQLDDILSAQPLVRAVNGVYVKDLTTGRVLFSYGADRQLNPASNVKLVTTAAALDALGKDFAYRTRLMGPAPDADGVVHGDVWLVGMNDPMLRTAHLEELAQQLAAAGVKRIEGDVVVGTDATRDSVGRADLEVVVEGGDEPGDMPTVTVTPDSAYLVVDTTATTVEAAPKIRLKLKVTAKLEQTDDGPRIHIVVAGRLRPKTRSTFKRKAARAALFTAHTLRAYAMLAGVEVTGGVRQDDELAAGLTDLAVHDSAPLSTMIARINKPSSNFLADRLVRTMAELKHGKFEIKPGVKVMTDWLSHVGIHRGYLLLNGSGLGRTHHLSARQIVDVLVAGTSDERFGPDYLASLSVAGQDGTLRRRFAHRACAGAMFGKTGTLKSVSALSGVVTTGGGNTLVFAILTNGFDSEIDKKPVRWAQADLVDAMYRFLAKRRPPDPPKEVAPPPAKPADPEVKNVDDDGDDEADDEDGAMTPAPKDDDDATDETPAPDVEPSPTP